jgi:hypothetical protein
MKPERDEITDLARYLHEAHADASGELRHDMPPKVQAVWDEVAKRAVEMIVGDHDFDGRFGEPLDFIVKMSKQWKKPLLGPLFKSLVEHAMFKERFEHAHEVKLANERHERCIVLWNVVSCLMGAEDVGDQDKVDRIAKVALEGGPLGHQGEIVEGVDRLSLDDLERASGAISRPRSEISVKPCPICGKLPALMPMDDGVTRWICKDGEHNMMGPLLASSSDAATAWNAVVDAWSRGVETGGAA